MFYFLYDGISSLEYKIKVRKVDNLSPPKRRTRTQEVDGMDGVLTIDEGSYENRLVKLDCQVMTKNSYEMTVFAEEIAHWLQHDPKYAKLILSDNTNMFYEAICVNNIDISRIIKTVGEFQIIFECKPFRKFVHADDFFDVDISNGGILNNPTRYCSNPIFIMEGTGNCELIINDISHTIENMNGQVELDVALRDAYTRSGDLIESFNEYFYGDWDKMQLCTGMNYISVVGNVTSLKINPRWQKI